MYPAAKLIGLQGVCAAELYLRGRGDLGGAMLGTVSLQVTVSANLPVQSHPG